MMSVSRWTRAEIVVERTDGGWGMVRAGYSGDMADVVCVIYRTSCGFGVLHAPIEDEL